MYRAQNHLSISADTINAARFNNQVIFNSGDSNPTIACPNGMVFVDYMELTAGATVTIKDGDGDTVATGVSGFDMTYTPMRLDHGMQITGTVLMLRAFIIEGCLP